MCIIFTSSCFRLKAQLALKEAKRKKKKETTKITEDETIEDELDPSSVEIVKKMENLLQEERVAYLNEQNLMAEVSSYFAICRNNKELYSGSHFCRKNS